MMRELPDGSIVFNSEPKEVPPGYEKTTDPHILVPIMPECSYRGKDTIKKRCCGVVHILFCDQFGERTTRKKCIECGGEG